MKSSKPPLPVIVVALLYLAVGIAVFAYHFLFGIRAVIHGIALGSVWVEATELLAVVIGVFLLRGHNWARWLAVAWMAFHVVLSAFHSYAQATMHAAFLALIAWALFAPAATRYFGKRNRAEA